MMRRRPFDSIYTQGFLRAATCVPMVEVASPARNLDETLKLAQEASSRDAALAVFPELGLTAYANDDLFFQDALLEAAEAAVAEIVRASHELKPVLIVGAPIAAEGKLFNCAVVIYRGRILGIVPKTYLPNYREFYEKRHFASAAEAGVSDSFLRGRDACRSATISSSPPTTVPDFAFHVEICEDLWTPISPSSFAALAGAYCW